MKQPKFQPGDIVECVDRRMSGEVKEWLPDIKEYAVEIWGQIWWLQEKELKSPKEENEI